MENLCLLFEVDNLACDIYPEIQKSFESLQSHVKELPKSDKLAKCAESFLELL